MALADNALTTLATAKSYLGVTGSSQDALLELLIGAVSEAVERKTGRQFKRGTYTEKYSGDGASARVRLAHAPAAASPAPTVTIDGQALAAASFLLATDGDALEYVSGAWPSGTQNIQVTYTGGYVLPKDEALPGTPRTLPMNIELAALTWLGYAWAKKDAPGVVSSSSGGMSATFSDGVPKDVAQLLAPYTRRAYVG